jgi:hypothetical protein
MLLNLWRRRSTSAWERWRRIKSDRVIWPSGHRAILNRGPVADICLLTRFMFRSPEFLHV